jgi:simple sugar transport system permease protein
MSVIFTEVFLVTLLAAGVRMAMPILLASVGEVFAERSGIVNINLEGQMLMGAFTSFVVGYYTRSMALSIAAGIAAGVVMAMMMSLACVAWHAQHTVAGITLNMFVLGFTSFWYRVAFGVTTAPPKADLAGSGTQAIPLLRDIPFLGPVLFDQNFLFYAAIGLVAIAYFVIFKTKLGLKIRAAGEYPRAAETMGVNVSRVRFLSMAVCGALAGLGGTFLSIISLNRFVDNITASRGFIALAIVIFGKWNPWLALVGALFFGVIDALQLRLQAIGLSVPYQLMLMLPYALTIVVMVLTSGKSESPAALGQDYEREVL